MSDSADRVNKRVNLACHYCRRRKKKCNGVRPTCSNCAAAGEQCVYQVRSTPSRTNIRFDILLSQMNRMETVLNKLAEDRFAVKTGGSVIDYPSSATSAPSTGGDESMTREEEQIEQEGLEESLEEGPAVDLPDFNDRLEQLMSNQLSGYFDSLIYMSGLFMSIFSPDEIDMLSRKLQKPQLLSWLTKTSHRIWRLQQGTMARLVDVPSACLDPNLIQFSIKLHLENLVEYTSRSSSLHRQQLSGVIFLTEQEIDPQNMSTLPSLLKKGIIAGIVIEGIITLRMSKQHIPHPWTKKFLDDQIKVAFHDSIDLLNYMRFSRPNYLTAKTCYFLLLHLSRFFCIPSIFVYSEPLLECTKALKVNCESMNTRLSPEKVAERKQLWSLAVWFHVQQTVSRLSLTKSFDYTGSRSYTEAVDPVKTIYERCRAKLFGLYKVKDTSRSEIYKEIILSSHELDSWWKTVNEHSKFYHMTSPEASIADSKPSGNNTGTRLDYIDSMLSFPEILNRLKYYVIRLIIYTIPAFYPEYLPYEVPNALDIVSETAHLLFNLAIRETHNVGVCHYIITLSTTTALGALLYKQLKYPNHPSNSQDIEIIEQGLPKLQVESWPMIVSGNNPIMELWNSLLFIMKKLYEVNNPSRNSTDPPVKSSLSVPVKQEEPDTMKDCVDTVELRPTISLNATSVPVMEPVAYPQSHPSIAIDQFSTPAPTSMPFTSMPFENPTTMHPSSQPHPPAMMVPQDSQFFPTDPIMENDTSMFLEGIDRNDNCIVG